MNFDTFEEFKEDWREKESLQNDGNLKVLCACGQHDLTISSLSDDELLDMYNIVRGLPRISKALELSDVGL